MRKDRHPHPHIDPRQPRDGSKPRTNPPVFAWKPSDDEGVSKLTVYGEAQCQELALELDGLADPVYLPEKALAPGRYEWEWSTQNESGERLAFEITDSSAVVEVPPVDEWLRRFSDNHPRIHVRGEELDALRESRNGERAELWSGLKADADDIVETEHQIAEPDYLPDKTTDYEAFWAVWYPTMWGSRRFVYEARTMALAFLAGGDRRYARAACERMASICSWDPEDSSYLGHNDEAHMSVIWNGPEAVDWVWDEFSESERKIVVECFRRRGEITFEHMHNQGIYGVDRFDSHAGREIVFLALIAIVFHQEIPEAVGWLEWLRPTLCGVWPVWADDDGGWAEGISYSLAYVRIMTMFATALKRGAGVDLYARPFWANHAEWRKSFLPTYAEWIGFGDHSEPWRGHWDGTADLVELIAHETNTAGLYPFANRLRKDGAGCRPTPPERAMRGVEPQRYLASPVEEPSSTDESGPVCRVFSDIGWAAIRTAPMEPDEDIAFLFRSSPYGAVSHSHANNNDFILHVAGRVMTMPSGYYAGYGSNHHAHWVWHTKSHNCVTLSGASQLMRSHDSVGSVGNPFEDERLSYFCGNADASYSDRATRNRRHVIFLKSHQCFVLVDEFVAKPGVASAFEWNLHSYAQFDVDTQTQSFSLQRDGRTLDGCFLFSGEGYFSLSDGWDPPPMRKSDDDDWRNQHHLKFTPYGVDNTRALGVVLSPGYSGLEPARVTTRREGQAEVGIIGDDLIAVRQSDVMEIGGVETEALAVAVVNGRKYEITDEGIAMVG